MSKSKYKFFDIEKPIAIVHRGGDAAGIEKENTMVQFKSAEKAGFKYFETDTIVSKDGVLIAFHGSKNKRAYKKYGLPYISQVQQMTYEEIKKNIDLGGESLPKLEELLLEFPEHKFFIDPKSDEAAQPLAGLINRLKIQDRVSVCSFKYSRTKFVLDQIGGQHKVCSAPGATANYLATGGLRWPIISWFFMPYFRLLKTSHIQLPHIFVTRRVVKNLQKSGKFVVIWPIDRRKTDTLDYIEKTLDLNADGILSDHTEMLKKAVLKKHPNNKSID